MAGFFGKCLCFSFGFVSSTKKMEDSVLSSANLFIIVIKPLKDSVYISIQLLTLVRCNSFSVQCLDIVLVFTYYGIVTKVNYFSRRMNVTSRSPCKKLGNTFSF